VATHTVQRTRFTSEHFSERDRDGYAPLDRDDPKLTKLQREALERDREARERVDVDRRSRVAASRAPFSQFEHPEDRVLAALLAHQLGREIW
jgi:hypothetical protein